jgi:threonine/homoserine/homoserine lactone efflux protein
VVAVTPGPSNVMLTAVGARVGVLRGLPSLLGVVSGMGTMMFLVPLGLGTLVLAHPRGLAGLRLAGAAFLLWLAWAIATSPVDRESAPNRSPVGYLSAAVFQWVNPKSWLVTASAAAAFLRVEAGTPVGQAASLAGLFVLAALPSCFLWLALGAAAQRLLGDRRRRRAFDVAMGVGLLLSILFIVR